jgi:mannosyltransferase OCH1-like enzyme
MSHFFLPWSSFELLVTVVVCGVAMYFVINFFFSPMMMESQQQEQEQKKKKPLSVRREGFEEEETFAIPGILWQTWFTHEMLPLAQFNVDELRRLNPDYSHRLVNDSEAAAFMIAHFGGQYTLPDVLRGVVRI